MSGLHTWAGLLLGWVLYAMFLTGTVSYFKDELSQWTRPELARLSQAPDQAAVAQRIADELGNVAAGSSQWSIRLPDGRNNSVYAFWRTRGQGQRAFGEANFDPTTGQKISSRETLGGEFFFRFHFQLHYMPVVWGRWIAGIAAMFMLVAIISGVITHKKIFVDFFTFRWGKGQRSWLEAHNALSVFGLPFHFMITYTGLVTLMALYMPWGENAAFKTPAERQQMTSELSVFIQPGKPSGQSAPLASVEDMVRQAQERWGKGNVGRVTFVHPGDAAARVAVARGEVGRVSMSPQYMEFEGTTGKLLNVRDSVGAAAETRGVLYALHLGRFSDTPTRWLYFLVSFMGTAMVGTGLVMWTVKRRSRLRDPERPHFGFRLVERLNIASIAGLSIAMTAFLWANRLLPHPMEARADWEIDAFFAVWALTLLHALLRPAKAAWIEQLWTAAALLFLLPVLNALTTQRPLWHSLAQGDWVFAGIDVTCWALALLHVVLAVRTARNRSIVQSRRMQQVPVAIASSGAAE
ncbi:PepSY domain-containing protein [Bradyrhizobium yuanmingense]|uniref:PepSY-associated TM helix domain-containing protein n=1 Tax=Bradyrhizobium yuanmingense TaxID=108015 RepID=UPI0012FC17DE|nr:PepSY-associated TM helix domain-containing protein [Bradyrhizobium yuanmingense]MVT51089.1 PepSY domain-containing protein [Bradyrhizobium yuanmingense]